jgi:putative salt-induced outer membrane protein
MTAMKKMLLAALLSAAFFAPPAAVAADGADDAADGEWSGSLGASLLVTDGNSQSRSVGGKVNAVWASDPWKNTFDASATNVSGSTGQTAERYLATDKVDYNITEHTYAFVAGEWEKDLFGPVRERTSETAGLGRHILLGPVHVLDAELGAGARQTKENGTGIRSNEAIGRFAAKYEWKFTDKNAFSENVKVESGANNTYSESVTALKLAIVGSLSSAISYTVRHNSDVPPGTEHVDTETAVNLVYAFGGK